jgi:hypothetical protein
MYSKGKIIIPTMEKEIKLKVAIMEEGKKRLIEKTSLERLFVEIGIDLSSLDKYKVIRGEYLSTDGLTEPLMEKYLKFENKGVNALLKGLALVGIIPLIDEVTGHNVIGEPYYQREFAKLLRGI